MTEKKSELEKIEPKVDSQDLVSVDNSEFSCYLDTAKFNQLQKAAKIFARSSLVPEHYRNKQCDCFIAMQMAVRLQIDPMAFMQGTYVVHGNPGMEAKLAIALMNTRGPFKGPVQWVIEGEGAKKKCTAYATHKVTNEKCEATVSWDMAVKEGWTTKKGSKWMTMPDLMFRYRSAVFLARLYCPEVMMGLLTIDELQDIGDQRPTDAPEPGVSGLKKHLDSRKQVESKEVEPEPDVTMDESKVEQPEPIQEELKQESPEPKALVNWKCNKCGSAFVEPNFSGKDAKVATCPDCTSMLVEKIKQGSEVSHA